MIAGFQSIDSINSPIPHDSILWWVNISAEFYTEDYFVGEFGSTETGPFFNPTFALAPDVPADAPTRFYSFKGYA